MKKWVKRSENGFDSKDDYIYTHVLGLKTLELEHVYFIKFVYLFKSFPLTTHLPHSNIKVKTYGRNTKIVQKGAKNLVFGAAVKKIPAVARI